MLQYDDFDDPSERRWLPYLMYFHRAQYRSDVINTDTLGFRIAHGADGTASLGGGMPSGPVRLFVGSSTALGIGATKDAATIPSRLWSAHATALPWLNFGGRSYSSAQELLLFLLYRHLLPEIDEIVIFSGLNNLALARLPEAQRGEHGAFFYCGEFFDQMEEAKTRHRKAKLGMRRRGGNAARPETGDSVVLPLDERIANAVELTARHLEGWQLLAGQAGTRISFVLQPLATWIREQPSPQERLVFDELDQASNFWQLYGDIATKDAGRFYAQELRQACEKLDIRFLDINPVLAEKITERNWMFVDRAHLTDEGHDIVSEVLADSLSLS
jgi:hypothetical protein